MKKGKERRKHSGKWSGLTAVTVSRLLNRSYYYTKKVLKEKNEELGREISLEDIGELIYEQKKLEECDGFARYFTYPGSL